MSASELQELTNITVLISAGEEVLSLVMDLKVSHSLMTVIGTDSEPFQSSLPVHIPFL